MVQVINFCDWMDKQGFVVEETWTVINLALESWCSKNNAYYYGRCREEFFIAEAEREAEARGCSWVVVEDLS